MFGTKKKKRFVSTVNATAYLKLKESRHEMQGILDRLSSKNLGSFSLGIVDKQDLYGAGAIGHQVDIDDNDPWGSKSRPASSYRTVNEYLPTQKTVPFKDELQAFLIEHYQKRILLIDQEIKALECD